MLIKTKCSYCGEEYNLKEELLWKKAKCNICKENFIIEKNNLKKEVEPDIKVIKKSDDLEIKPNKISFILFSNPLIIIFSILGLIWLFISFYSLLLFLLVFLLFAWENIKWKKEKYILTDRKIIFYHWTLISDNSTEINLDRITEIKASLPFLQDLFFKTGDLYIKTAWAGLAKIRFSSIDNTLDIYEEFRLRMQKNGFYLKKEKLVQSEKPHIIWVIWEVFWKLLWILIVGFFILIPLLSRWNEFWEVSFLVTLVPFLILSGIILFITITILDLKRRKYEIFTDSIWYSEWFLSKHYAFIPMEVVSDVENTQSFFSKIFGLHDIIISSSGASNKVIFKNMTNWETMIKNLRYLKDHIIMSKQDTEEEKVSDSIIWFKDKIENPLDFDKEFEGHFKMNISKTLFEVFALLIIFIPILFIEPGAFFWLLIIFIITWAWNLIQLFFTNYNIRESAIEKKFDFFSVKFNSFSIEKITWIQFKQSFIDKWFWTMTVIFWSIGSDSPIVFENIKKTKWLEEQILAKVWIRKEEKQSNIKINFNITNFFKANILKSFFMIILFPITIIIFIYSKIFFEPKRYLWEIYKNYIKTQKWIFFITKKYVLYRHIKEIVSTKYPITDTGSLYLNVAWWSQVDTNNKWWNLWFSSTIKNLSWIISNTINILYVSEVFESHNKLDSILNWKEINQTKLTEAKQDIKNTVILMIISIIFIIFIPIAIWLIKVKYWYFEENRVLFGSWIIYKKRQSILYQRFNFVDLKKGLLNKIFQNGSINVYTIWSSSIDMKIPDIENYTEVYQLLKK